MPIYTGGGDDGATSLFGGERVSKHALRIELMGAIDEVSAALGMAVVHLRGERAAASAGPAQPTAATEGQSGPASLAALLQRLQGELFVMGADIATPHEPRAYAIPRITADHAEALETAIDEAEAELPPLTDFILPGGNHAAAALHFARGICRRTERSAVALAQDEDLPKPILVYLNRLSDLLFTLARLANHPAGVPDVLAKDALAPE